MWCGQTLTTVTSAKYLGITIHKEDSWDSHIGAIKAKANWTQRFLRHNVKISSRQLREMAHLAFVRPIAKYGSSVWDPNTKKQKEHIDKTETIERRAAHFVLKHYHNTSTVSAIKKT